MILKHIKDMKTRYFLIAAFALLTLSLNAQTKATKKLVNPKTPVEKIVTPPDGYFRMGPSRASSTPVTPPYSNGFDSDSEWNWWETIDVDGDGDNTYGNGKWTLSNNQARYYYHSSNAANDWLITAPIVLQAGKTYKISFDATASTYFSERLEVKLASTNTAAALSNGTTVIESTTFTGSRSFSNENITVSASGQYYIGIHAISDANMYYLNVDNFAIEVGADPVHDLSVALSAPSQAGAGANITVTATVTNNGSFDETGYTVTFTAGGTTFATQTANEPLAAGATATFTAQYPTNAADAGQTVNFGATVTCTDDADATNNSATASTSLITLPPPENVAATANENQASTMTWSAPSTLPMRPGTVTENFDDTSVFPSFSVGGITSTQHMGAIGDWTLYDATGQNVYGISGITYTNRNNPQAWIVFNSAIAASNITAHSGSQFMMTTCPGSSTIASDHWLISPELSGNAQTITFWERTLTSQYGDETYEVLASSTDNNPSSFTLVQSLSDQVTTWTERSVTLPAGTKYFAIRHISLDIFGLAVDDITYETLLPTQPVSYNIYLDGQLVDNVNSDVFSYTFNNLTADEHTCAVSAVYPGGLESAAVPATIPAPTPVTQGTVSPSAVSFGEVQVGQSATQTVTITNTGNQPFTPVIDATSLPAGVTVSTASQIAAGGNLPLTVTFAPTAEGAVSGSFTVTIPVPDGEDLTFTVSVTGTGYIISSTLTSQTVVVPVYKSDIQAPSRTYVFSREEVKNDTLRTLNYSDGAKIQTQVLVKNEEPVVSYDLHRKAGSGNWTYPGGNAVAQAVQQSSPSTYVVGQETFTIPQDATQLWVPMTDEGVDASSELMYVPVTVADGVVTTGNTYGAPQVAATSDGLTITFEVTGSKSAGGVGGNWDQTLPDSTTENYCVYSPVITIKSVDPAFGINTRLPYMFRAWLLVDNSDIYYYDIKRVPNTNDPTHGHIVADSLITQPKLLGTIPGTLDMVGHGPFGPIGYEWTEDGPISPSGNVKPENVFGAPSDLGSRKMKFAVRVYYYKPQAETPSGHMLRAAGDDTPEDGYAYADQDESDSQDIQTAVSSIYGDREVVDVQYVNALGQQSSKPFEGVNIVVTRYSDGTMSTTKVLK